MTNPAPGAKLRGPGPPEEPIAAISGQERSASQPYAGKSLKILTIHNSYRQGGGEDTVVEQEAALLRARGDFVIEYRRTNAEIPDTRAASFSVALSLSHSSKTESDLNLLLSRETPDIAHFHNTFPLITPSAYAVLRRRGIPIVQTLHNCRQLCPASTLFRNGRECRDCVSLSVPWPAVAHACYRGSRAASAAVALMLARARAAGTFARDVDLYLAVSKFIRDEHVAAGLPADKIIIKENCLAEDSGPGDEERLPVFLFAGRLSPEKGVSFLLDSWGNLRRETPLRILGDGPLAQRVARTGQGVFLHGAADRKEVLSQMRQARAVVVPSLVPEACPMVIIEAMAAGTPVIASRIGGIPGLVEDGVAGLLVAPGDCAELARAVDTLRDDAALARSLGRGARRAFDARFSPAVGTDALRAAYVQAIQIRRKGP